jgi:hypothetical protein
MNMTKLEQMTELELAEALKKHKTREHELWKARLAEIYKEQLAIRANPPAGAKLFQWSKA